MNDSRLLQISSLVSEARTIVAEMLDETIPTEQVERFLLHSLRFHFDRTLKTLDRLKVQAS
jgi:hypothetical protein